jgi:hypothetical protein
MVLIYRSVDEEGITAKYHIILDRVPEESGFIEAIVGKYYRLLEQTHPDYPAPLFDAMPETGTNFSLLTYKEVDKFRENLYQLLRHKVEQADEEKLEMLIDMKLFLKSLQWQATIDALKEEEVTRIVDVLSSQAPYQNKEGETK